MEAGPGHPKPAPLRQGGQRRPIRSGTSRRGTAREGGAGRSEARTVAPWRAATPYPKRHIGTRGTAAAPSPQPLSRMRERGYSSGRSGARPRRVRRSPSLRCFPFPPAEEGAPQAGWGRAAGVPSPSPAWREKAVRWGQEKAPRAVAVRRAGRAASPRSPAAPAGSAIPPRTTAAPPGRRTRPDRSPRSPARSPRRGSPSAASGSARGTAPRTATARS